MKRTQHNFSVFAFHICKAILWTAQHSAEDAQAHRESVISSLEWANVMQRESGECQVVDSAEHSSRSRLQCAFSCIYGQAWFAGSDRHTRAVAGQANGLLFSQLLEATGYCDKECTELFRTGTRRTVQHIDAFCFSLAIIFRRAHEWSPGAERRGQSNRANRRA